MAYYIIVATIIFIGYFTDKRAKKYLAFSMFVLFIFTAFRNINVGGTDVQSYIAFYKNRVPQLSHFFSYDIFKDYEIGFALINSIAKTLFGSFFSFQIIYTSISLLLLYCVIEKTDLKDNEKCLLLFVYFTFRYFLNAMGLLRQNLANEVFWLVLLTLCNTSEKRKNILAYLLTALNWLLHRSGFFCVAFLPLINYLKKISQKKVLIITIILSIINLNLSSSIINKAILFAVKIGGTRYGYFIEDEKIQGFNIIFFLLRWCFFIIFYFIIEHINYEKKYLVFAIGAVAIICGSINIAIFTRILEYFMIGIYVMIVLSTRVFTMKSRKIYVIIMYIMFLVIMIRNLHTTSGGLYLNYKFYI